MENWKLQPARDLDQAGLARYRNPLREHGLVSSLLRLAWWSLVRGTLKIVNRLHVQGQQHLPASGPYVLVANHESHLDALVLASVVPLAHRDRLFPLAAGDVFFESTTMAAFAAHFLNALPVWRRNAGRHGLTDLRRRLLEEQAIYILFPEGGRSRDGDLKPFKAGIGMLVAGTPVPVVPCYLDGPLEAFPPGSRVPRWHPVSVRIGPARCFSDIGENKKGWEYVMQTLEQDVRRLGGLADVEVKSDECSA